MASAGLIGHRSTTAGLVFAGGQSKRMGADKALLDFGGEPLIERVLGALDTLGPTLIVGGNETDFSHVNAAWCRDVYPGQGPLGALITGLQQVHADIVVAAACDLPHLRSNTVEQLVDQLRSSSADVATPLVSGTHQWHVAAWTRRSLPALEAAFARGERSLRSVARELGVVSVVFASARDFADVDTPSDLARACAE